MKTSQPYPRGTVALEWCEQHANLHTVIVLDYLIKAENPCFSIAEIYCLDLKVEHAY